MKTTKNYFLLLMLTLGIGLFNASCSSSDNSSNDDNDPPPPGKTELIISASKTSIKINEEVSFLAKWGNETTKDIKFSINDQEIEADKYTFTEVGEYTVTAKKSSGEKSNSLKISVFKNDDEINNATKFAHRVLVEDFTGAWCQWCPLVAYDIEQLEKNHGEKIQAIAIHNEDPFDFFKRDRNAYEREVGVNGYPFATINRQLNFRDNPNKVIELHKEFSSIGIKIESEMYATDGVVKIGIKFGENYTAGVKYAVFMLEDHLIYKQANSTQYYQDLPKQGGYSLNFEHNNTLVGMVNGFRGTEIGSSVAVKGGEFTNTNIYLTHKAANLDNTKIVVVVTDMAGAVLNVAVAKSNTNMSYQVVR
ncbi:Omp28-related outer membrane protein [Myroides odoratus]|uniref:Omp28-related outer membrane protein n=1 Tax=Myroides odoratus TaxID=256 RepID=UPI0039AED0CF